MLNVTVLAGFALMTFLPCAIAVLGNRDAEHGWEWPAMRSSRQSDAAAKGRLQAILRTDRLEAILQAPAAGSGVPPGTIAAQDFGNISDPAIASRTPNSVHRSRAMRSEIEALQARAAAARAEAELHEANARAAAAKAEAAAVDAMAAEAAAAAAIQEMRRAA